MEPDSIVFSAKYKNWIAIKNLSIHDDTMPEEVSLHLASIKQTIDRKSFEILGINTQELDSYAANMTSGTRKSVSNLSEVLHKLNSVDSKNAIEDACNKKQELTQIANAYLLRKILQDIGFGFDLNAEMLAKAYPELKKLMPKPRGRKPKE